MKRIAIPVEAKHPIILPRQHRATKLLIEWIHRRSGHVGAEHTFSLSREKYWIMSGRVLVNQVVMQCFFCRVRRAKQQFPYMADLPVCRAAVDQPPFYHCGVDLFGPITVKQLRRRLKRWVVLFTCLTIRCVHMEIVEDCTTSLTPCEDLSTDVGHPVRCTQTMAQILKEQLQSFKSSS